MSAVGRRIDRYVVEAELDSGGFGTVYRARHTVIGRTVALKLLHAARQDSLAVVERFLREARIVAALSSPHVVQVLDAGMTEDRQLFLTMELLEGGTLAARLAKSGALPVREAISIARQILAGLAAAHAAGVVHRDLKPANVFLARQPDHREVAKVLDFGISKSRTGAPDDAITMTGAVLGTPHYMAPEQLQGARDVDARADLYAVAVVLYEMLSARLPYEAQTLEHLIAKRMSDPPTSLGSVAPHLPREVLAIVDRGLARDPDARFRTAQEFDAALASLERVPMPATSTPQERVVVSGARPVTPSLALGATQASASDAATGPMASGAGVMRSPLGRGSPTPAIAAATPTTLPPGTTTFPTRGISIGVLVTMLLGAGLLIVVLIAALASVTTAWLISRDAPAAPQASAPVIVGSGTPQAPPPPPPQPAWDPFGGQDPFGVPALGGSSDPPPTTTGPMRTWVERVVGHVDRRAMDDLIARTAPEVERCRGDADADVRLQVFVNPGGAIPISQPDVNRAHGDETIARCVARALQGGAPISDPGGSGIVEIGSHLPARAR